MRKEALKMCEISLDSLLFEFDEPYKSIIREDLIETIIERIRNYRKILGVGKK